MCFLAASSKRGLSLIGKGDWSDESDSINPNEDYMTDSDSEKNIIDDSDDE